MPLKHIGRDVIASTSFQSKVARMKILKIDTTVFHLLNCNIQ